MPCPCAICGKPTDCGLCLCSECQLKKLGDPAKKNIMLGGNFYIDEGKRKGSLRNSCMKEGLQENGES